ncbi:hypothetical protein ACFLQL_01570 [Verrucomicrobiota bacterium]
MDLKVNAKKHSFYIWACGKIWELKEQLDPRITPEYLLGLLTLQEFKCTITHKQLHIPSNESLAYDQDNYTDWFNKLTNEEQLRVPLLATFSKHDDIILAGCCGFIINALVPLYQLHGGLSELVQKCFHNPISYQYTVVMCQVKELNLNQ